MAMIDLTIVNVAAPMIQLDLHTSDAGLQLIVAGYIVTSAMTLITGARPGPQNSSRRGWREHTDGEFPFRNSDVRIRINKFHNRQRTQ